MELSHGFSSELSWKIFLDRYTVKDPTRSFVVGDVAIALVEPHPKWPKKDIGIVREVLPDGYLSIELVTGPEKGDLIERKIADCDRPLERSIFEVARRVAQGVAKVESDSVRASVEQSFATEIAALRFIPGGRIWAGAGTDQQLTYFNCYVIPSPRDSREGIVETLGQMIEIMSRGGGVGINISSLRPSRAAVRGVNGRSSGAVSWMDLYSRATGLVEQGGCFSPETRIATTAGLIPAAELFARMKSGESFEALTHEGPQPITQRFNNGEKQLWRVTTERGYTVEVTEDHKMGVMQEGRIATIPLKALGEGDDVLLLLGQGVPDRPISLKPLRRQDQERWPEVMTERLAYLAGALTLSGRDMEPGIRERCLQYSRELFHREPSAANFQVILEWLRDNGLLQERPESARVPEMILAAGSQVMGAFISGYFDAAGSVEDSAMRYQFDSISLALLQDVQHMLAASGIASGINHRDPGNGAAYRLTVDGRECAERFQQLACLSRQVAGDSARLGATQTGARAVSYSSRGEDSTERTAESAVATVGGLIRTLSDRIVSILPTRVDTVYDFEVEHTHMLSGNGLYTSNSRRGALMLQIEDWHPDLWRFIEVKKTPGMVENANISVRISDGFMSAVKADGDWDLVFPDTTDPDYDETWDGNLEAWKTAGKPVVIYETVKARKIWHAIIEGAWEAAEPGIVFDERHEKDSNSWYFNPLISTNPCAEQPLPAWGVCTLGHINLAAFYDPAAHDVNWDALRETVRVGTRFLDDIVDATPYFFQQNYDNQQKERRIGLGTMGLGELLIRLELRYGSPESLDFIERLYQYIAVQAYDYDVELAKEKGAFPAFDPDLYLQSGFIKRLPENLRHAIHEHGVRNVTILTQAPTGTVGTMVGTSTGIEPYYALTYFRQSRLGYDEQYVPVAAEWKTAHPEEELPAYFVGAMDLTPEEHVYVQAAIQKWTDSSISKTANAPSTYTVEDTEKLYELAYDLGCKGVTIYRDQSRSEQVLHLVDDQKTNVPTTNSANPSAGGQLEVYPVPSLIHGRTYRKETPAGTARVVINEVDDNPFEVFMLLGRAGSEVQSFMESLGRVISLYLRSNGNLSPRRRLELVAEQLKGIGGANQMGFGPGRVLSVVDAIGQLLESHLRSEPSEVAAARHEDVRETLPESDARHSSPHLDLCPLCDAPTLVYEEGCQHCQSCGYSKC